MGIDDYLHHDPLVRKRPLERYLLHSNTDHDGFAMAMNACQGYAPNCSDVGACMHDGECFGATGNERAARAIEALADIEPDRTVRTALKRAASDLRIQGGSDEA